jgi:predicted glutamine amidotransferase
MCQLLGINCSDEVDVSEVFSGFAQKGGASNPHGEFSFFFFFFFYPC